MGIMDALNVGMAGLGAAQQSIDITGQNISNANTEGYSRKRVEQSRSFLRQGRRARHGRTQRRGASW